MTSTQNVKPWGGRQIGLYGGSFDPPHAGHESVLRELVSKNLFDEIWLVPVFAHPFGKTLSAFADRVQMLKILCDSIGNPKLKICEIEKNLPAPNYTVLTVQALKREFPDYNFHILVGSDVKNDLQKWHKIDELKQLATFYFFPREGYEASTHPQIASSEVRELVRNNGDISALVSPEIVRYIQEHQLYK